MTTTTTLKWINEAWLAKKKSDLSLVSDTSPCRADYLREIEAAEYHLDAKKAVIAEAAKAGYRLNQYAGTCVVTGEEVAPLCGFVRKVDGRWKTYSRDVVIEELGIQIIGLPELD